MISSYALWIIMLDRLFTSTTIRDYTLFELQEMM